MLQSFFVRMLPGYNDFAIKYLYEYFVTGM